MRAVHAREVGQHTMQCVVAAEETQIEVGVRVVVVVGYRHDVELILVALHTEVDRGRLSHFQWSGGKCSSLRSRHCVVDCESKFVQSEVVLWRGDVVDCVLHRSGARVMYLLGGPSHPKPTHR